jgi:galactose-1-phosphate uridylyltransferase
MQILVRDRPFYLVDLMLEKSKMYHENHGSSYWHDLLAKERNGERYLFDSDHVEWLVPFAPLRGLNEFQAIVERKSNLKELDGKDWHGLAKGMTRVLQFYHSQGYTSFNAIVTSGPLDEHLDYFDVNVRIISRPGVQRFCFTDAWAVPYLLWDGEAVEQPEKLAERARGFFKTS